jgi:hypothetical protein
MSQRPHIVILVPRGEVIRSFLYSRTLELLTEQARVSILSVICDDRFTRYFRDRCQLIAPLEEIRERYLVRLVRQLLEYSHERRMWSRPAQVRWRERAARNRAAAARTKWLLKRIIARACGNRLGLIALSRLERRLSNLLEPTSHYTRLLRELKPDLVFNGSHIHSPAAVLPVQAAARLGITTATFVFSWDNLTSRGRIFLPYDHFLMWNEKMEKQLLAMYPDLDPGRTSVTGTPQFDFHFDPRYIWSRERFCSHVGADPQRPIVLYSTGMAHQMPEEPLIVRGISTMLRGMTDLGPPQLLVRVYAKDRTERFERLKKELPDVLFPDVPWDKIWLTPHHDDLALLTSTLHHAACGINVASTISLELAMLDKPVINVAYDPPGIDIAPVRYSEYYHFDHYRPVVESQAIQLASSEQEMAELLQQALRYPGQWRDERRTFIESFFGPYLDGRCGERVAQRLLALADHGRKAAS